MVKKIVISVAIVAALLSVVMFVPPIRNFIYSVKLWPFPTPWDVNDRQLARLKTLARPGDVIVEKNLHNFQWIVLCYVGTGSTWVHTAIVDENNKIVSMMMTVKVLDMSVYRDKQSTSMVLVRPPYRDEQSIERALAYARSNIGTPFDADLENQAGNCTGLVAGALEAGGISVRKETAFLTGDEIYPAEAFLEIPDAEIIWRKGDSGERSRMASSR